MLSYLVKQECLYLEKQNVVHKGTYTAQINIPLSFMHA